jgi:hypothetical protein
MSKLRDDLRRAFEREQALLGDLAGTRQRLVSNAMAAQDTSPESRMPLAAGVAAVVIAALVIATFAYVRSGVGVTHHGPPIRLASPTPLNTPLNVSNDTPVILYGDPANSQQVDGMSWDGKQPGKVDWPGSSGAANPSANLFASSTEVRDRTGRLVASGTFGAKGFGGTWADDGQHFCQMVPFDTLGANGLPATLQVVTPGQPPHNVAQVGKVYEQVITRVAACSVRKDRAVVVQGYGNSPSTAQYWMVQLSTGKVLWTHSFDVSNAVTVVASPGAEFIAENSGTSSTIYGSDGSVAGRLNVLVEGFCWDGSLVVTDTGFGSGQVSEVAWASGNMIWAAPAGYSLLRTEPQPDGSGLAIWIASRAQVSQSQGAVHPDMYVVASDGLVIAHVHD